MKRASGLLCLSVWVCTTAWAGDAAAPPADEEMLDFLGEFATDDGGWLAPQVLNDAGMLERADLAIPETANDGGDVNEPL
jgi:hypothetical protein